MVEERFLLDKPSGLWLQNDFFIKHLFHFIGNVLIHFMTILYTRWRFIIFMSYQKNYGKIRETLFTFKLHTYYRTSFILTKKITENSIPILVL